ncbi:MAG: hypothetical protein MJ221_00240 [Bacilli bacterium]|nr:hypothetical protein [Bacilli bacterium]
MNKKLFVLLPAAALLLAGCNGNNSSGSTTTSSSSSSTTSQPIGPSAEDYGTAEAPLTIAKFLANVDRLVEKVDEVFSDFPFYVKGLSDGNALWDSGYSQFNTFYLKDSLSDSKGAKVQRSVPGAGVASEPIGKGDTIALVGYAEYYNGGYSFFPNANVEEGGSVTVSSVTRAQSTLTVNKAAEHVSVVSPTSFAEKYVNGTVIPVELSVDSGWLVEVKVNGVAIQPGTDGKYSVTVLGPTTLDIEVEIDAVREDLPAGNYQLVITNTNSGLGESSAGAVAVNKKYSLKADEDPHYYKRLEAKYSNKCYNQSNYGEWTIGKGGNVLFATPCGKITTVVAEFYKSQSGDFYANEMASGEKLKGVPGTATGDHVPYTFTVNNDKLFIDVQTGAAYTQSFYSLTINIVVE